MTSSVKRSDRRDDDVMVLLVEHNQDSGDSLGEAIKNVTLHTPISLNRSNYPVSLRGYIKLI